MVPESAVRLMPRTPSWTEAKSLIRGMLQLQPASRLTIKEILSHAWFTKRIVDPPLHTVPGAEGHGTPAQRSPEQEMAFQLPDSARVTSPLPQDVGWMTATPGPLARMESIPSPLSEVPVQAPGNAPASAMEAGTGAGAASTVKSVTLVAPRPESEGTDGTRSETSFDFQDSERSKTDSGLTTPTTPEEGDTEPEIASPHPEHLPLDPVKDTLTLLQSNESQTTIRKQSEGSVSRRSSGSGTAVTSRSKGPALADQREEDEFEQEHHFVRRSSTLGESGLDNRLHLPVALHSRTPSRTKRRSVSSTLSDRRPTLTSSASFHANEVPVVDYLAELNEKAPPLFSTASERELLNSLARLGFDTGQLVHSVMTDACDASGAIWWMLRCKQFEEHDHHHQQDATEHATPSAAERTPTAIPEPAPSQAIRPDVFAQSGSSETIVKMPTPKDLPALAKLPTPKDLPSPYSNAVELGPALLSPKAGSRPTISPLVQTRQLPPPRSPGGQPLEPPPPAPPPSAPKESPIYMERTVLPPIPGSPTADRINLRDTPPHHSPSASPSRRGEVKNRSTSFTMLQRATSVFNGSGLVKRKSSDKLSTGEFLADPAPGAPANERKDRYGKLTKQGPDLPGKDIPAHRNATQRSVSEGTVGRGTNQQQDISTSSSYGTVYSLASMSSSAMSADDSPSKGKQGKSSRKDGLLTTFRSWFNEDRRKRKRAVPPSPISSSGKVGGYAMNRIPSVRSQHSHAPQRITVVSRISSPYDGRPPLHSRRSSSVNSRRSSVASLHAIGMDYTGTSPVDSHGLYRRVSGGRKSAGSRTPTSEVEYNPTSRPSSVHSVLQPIAQHGKSASTGSINSNRGVAVSPAPSKQSYRGRSHRHSRASIGSGHPHYRSSSTTSSRHSDSSRRSSGEHGDFGPTMEEPMSDHSQESASLRNRSGRSADDRRLTASVIVARRTKSPLSSNMSFADHQRQYRKGSDPPSLSKRLPRRDVFAANMNAASAGDDDWISEEEGETGYAGGLGQAGSKALVQGNPSMSAPQSFGSASAVWKLKDLSMDSQSLVLAPKAVRQPRHTKDISKGKGTSVAAKKQDLAEHDSPVLGADGGWDASTRANTARGLVASSRPTRIVEEEEEEED